MQFSASIVIAALVGYVSAQANPFTLSATTLSAGFKAGSPVDITWSPTSSGTVTLLLKQGIRTDLDTVSTIVANTANTGSFTWTPATSLVQGSDYALEIVDDTNTNSVNYSEEFTINSSNTVSSSAPSSTASKASSTALTSASSTTHSSSTTASSSATGSSTASSSKSSSTSSSSSHSSSTLATKTTSSTSSTSASASQTFAVATGEAMRFKVGGSMLALVGAVMVAL